MENSISQNFFNPFFLLVFIKSKLVLWIQASRINSQFNSYCSPLCILKLRVVFRQLSTYILSHPVEGRLSPAISTNYNCPSPHPPIFSPSSTTIFFDNIQTCGVYEWIRARNVNVWIMNIVWQNHYCSTSVSKQKWCVKRSLSYQVPWQPNSQIKGVWCTTDHRLENRCVLRKGNRGLFWTVGAAERKKNCRKYASYLHVFIYGFLWFCKKGLVCVMFFVIFVFFAFLRVFSFAS